MSNTDKQRRYAERRVIFCATLSMLLFSSAALSEQWKLTPSITLEERYDDNIKLTTDPHESVTGTLLKGKVGFSRLTENSGVTGRIHLDLSDYSGDEVAKDNNSNLHLSLASHYGTELVRWGLNGSFKKDTTLRNIEFIDDEPDFDIDDGVDSGIVNVDIERNAAVLTPSWEYKLDERTTLNAGYSYLDVSYKDNPSGSGLFDYDQNSVSAGIFYKLSERDTINARVGFLHFQSPGNFDNKVDSYDFTLGYKRNFSEILSGSIDFGANYTEQESSVLNTDTGGYILQLKLNRKTEVKRFSVSLGHDLKPSGSGSVVETSQLKLKMVHNFSRRLSGGIAARYFDRKPLVSTQGNTERYFSIEPSIKWKFDRWWTVAGGYRFRSNENANNIDTAESNAVFVSLRHNKSLIFD